MQAGVSAIFADRRTAVAWPRAQDLATALAAFELAWVDGGAATCLVALGLALQPILGWAPKSRKRRTVAASVPHPAPADPVPAAPSA